MNIKFFFKIKILIFYSIFDIKKYFKKIGVQSIII